MIVRISGEEQYELADGALERLNELENACQAAVEAGDEERFHGCYAQLLELIRTRGLRARRTTSCAGSDLMLPPPDITLEEAGASSRRGADPGLDRDPPEREPALQFGLDRQFGGHLRLELQLALGRALLGALAGRRRARTGTRSRACSCR